MRRFYTAESVTEGPVSYTHLDVYKRQKETCDISLPWTGWTAAGRGIFYNRLGRNSSVPLAIVV